MNQSKINVLVIWTLLLAGMVAPVMAQGARAILPQRKYALLIGINEYSRFSDLTYCDDDVAKLSKVLNDGGFDKLIVLRDGAEGTALQPSRNNIVNHIETLLEIVNENDLVFVAFSGHGVHIGGESYVCPSDARLDRAEETMISVDELYEMLRKCRARQKVVMIDACRNDPTAGRKGPADKESAIAFARAIQSPPKGIILFSSCGPKQYSIEDSKFESGVFMHFVCKGLQGAAAFPGNDVVTVASLYSYVERNTKDHVFDKYNLPQVPEMRGEFDNVIQLVKVAVRRPTATASKEGTNETEPTPESTAETPVPQPSTPPEKAEAAVHPLLAEAKTYSDNGDYDKAIVSLSKVIGESKDATLVKEARLARGDSYLMNDPVTFIEQALADYLAAGETSVSVIVATDGDLRSGKNFVGQVSVGQEVGITKVVRLQQHVWLRVESIDGEEVAPAYLDRDSIAKPLPIVVAPQPIIAATRPNATVARPNTRPQGGGYGPGGRYGPPRGSWRRRWSR